MRSEAFLIFAMFVGCSSKGTDSTAGFACPTTADDIQAQILKPACTASGCHGVENPALGLDLQSPNMSTRLVDVTSNGCGNQTLVVARDPEHSYLVQKLTTDTPACGDRMPLGGPGLSSTQLACVQAWITQLGSSNSVGGASGPGVGGGASSAGGQPGSGGASSMTGTAGQGGTSTVRGSGGQANMGGNLSTGGATTCGPAVSFTGQVQPIFTASCASSGCHVGQRPSGSLSLAAGTAYSQLVNVASSTCATRTRVKPSSVSNSYLMDKLFGTNLCSGTQMPKTGGGLPATEIDAISSWICEGAPNN